MKIKTIPYKGSKRKLLNTILSISEEIEFESFFDGFSGTGIVSAFMRHKGYVVSSNDKMPSASLYTKVFLSGFNQAEVDKHLKVMNGLSGTADWVTNNYSGVKRRIVRGTGGTTEERPLGFKRKNALKIDAARNYVQGLPESPEKNALIFSIILASNKVFNNSNDQKSCLKKWTKSALNDITFEGPTNIRGPLGKSHNGDILDLKSPKTDIVYFDPPYTTGVLYDACYHLNDSLYLWDKPDLDHSYAIPRPKRVTFKKQGIMGGKFYSKKTAKGDFCDLFNLFDCRRIILSYSDAPRNVLTYEELLEICQETGTTKIVSKDHKLCMQASSLKKISTDLKEFFFIVDKK
tara:strand:- start:111 stop:1154 length:1044 start_codon:yes stop_codon:yes gene_type:complete